MQVPYSWNRTRTLGQCRICGQFTLGRVARRGFWQRRILALFGLYPWQCMTCGSSKWMRKRGTIDQGAGTATDEGGMAA